MNKRYIHAAEVRERAPWFCLLRAMSLGFLLFMEGGLETFAQAPATSWGWTSNLHTRIEVLKANTNGSVQFTIAPEDQNKVARSHWPIVFIDYTNNGNRITQMYNISEDRTFTVDLNNPEGKVTIYGEDGLWKLVATGQDLKDAKLEKATGLRYVDLSDNVLGTANADAKYTFKPFVAATTTEEAQGNIHLQTLKLNHNKLKKIEFIAQQNNTLEELYASENLFPTMDLTAMTKLSRIDLSKNLLTDFRLPNVMPNNNRDIYVGGNHQAFNVQPASPAIYTAKTAANNWLDLSVNKLNIATLPALPNNLLANNYIYTLQERYKLPLSKANNDVFELLEEIDISSQLRSQGIAQSSKITSYDWYIEKDAAKDTYELLEKGKDYTEKDGKFKFHRGFGKQTRIFAAMKTDAFPLPLESFERLSTPAEADYTTGFNGVTNQPAGGVESSDIKTYKNANSGVPEPTNRLGDGTTRELSKRFYRTNTITLDATHTNYWYGFVDHDWAKAENWTGRFVPPTLPETAGAGEDAYKGSDNSTVEFATQRNYLSAAIRDLHVDDKRKIYDYTNLSESGRALVIPAGTQLQIVNGINLGDYPTREAESHSGGVRFFQNESRLRVKSAPGKFNGTLLVGNLTKSPATTFKTYAGLTYDRKEAAQRYAFANKGAGESKVYARVEFYSSAFDGNRNKQDATWQYFGSPVKNAVAQNTFDNLTWVRKYERTKSDEHDEKWNEITPEHVLVPTAAYEISQPQPITHTFYGELNTSDLNITGITNAGTAPYADWNIYANPYTAAMDISKVVLNGTDQVVYLFNHGTRKQWLAANQPAANTTTGETATGAGYYTAIPVALAGRLSGLPTSIPSMGAFALRATGTSGTMTYAYKNLAQNTQQNRIRGRSNSLPAIIIDVESRETADRVILAETKEATPRYDNGYDGEKVFASGTAQLYALADRKYEVASTDEIVEAELGFVAGDEAKDYTLSFTMSDELNTRGYYLLDRKLGTTLPVQSGDVYRFRAMATDAPNRFLLTTKAASIDKEVVSTSIDLRISADRKLTATNHTEEEAIVEVFDLKGKRLRSFKVAAGDSVTETLDGIGVYVVKANNSQATVVERYRVN